MRVKYVHVEKNFVKQMEVAKVNYNITRGKSC